MINFIKSFFSCKNPFDHESPELFDKMTDVELLDIIENGTSLHHGQHIVNIFLRRLVEKK